MQITCDPVAIGQDLHFSHLSLRGRQPPGERSLVSEGGHHIELFVAERLFIGTAKCDQHTGNSVGGTQRQHQGGPGLHRAVDREVKPVEPAGRTVVKDSPDRRSADGNRHLLDRRGDLSGHLYDDQVVDLASRRFVVERHRHQGGCPSHQRQRFLGDEPKHHGRVRTGQHLRSDVAGCLDPRFPGP
ncbi:Uncharacterised protein [Mycobacterium tuberculosis]|nr:Uncharacterised protein [Mycobacterium tuberculosis]